MKTILVLLDTVRKDYLEVYNKNTDVKTPNLTEFASEAAVFENHCTGSLPCMPARRDLFTGKLDFFERFWGGLEPFDRVLQKELSLNGISSHIITDHHHYWRHGGEGYLQNFDTFEMIRGQESDPWVSSVDGYQMPEKTHGRFNQQFELNKSKFETIDEFPAMKTFKEACDFIDSNKDKESFFLQVEGFDPHEPFHAPQEFLDMYNVSEDDIEEFYNSPKYGPCTDSKEQLEHIIKKYKANTTFADYALGMLFDKLKEHGIYDDCNIIFTTDHGFHLGDHGVIGKGITHCYNELSQIPLIHKLPGQKEQIRSSATTQNICLFPTLVEQYGIEVDVDFDGESYLACISGTSDECLDLAVSGYFGSSVTVNDGRNILLKAPSGTGELNMYTAMPTGMKGYIGSPYGMFKVNHEDIEMGRFLKRTNYPVFKFNFGKGLPMGANNLDDELYAKADFYHENKLDDEQLKNEMETKLKNKMEQLNVPSEQFERLGL